MSELFAIFRAEVADRIHEIDRGLASETWPPAGSSLALAAHALRGASRIVGLANADRIAGALNKALKQLEKSGAPPSSTLRLAMRRVPAWFESLLGQGDGDMAAWDAGQAGVIAQLEQGLTDAASAPSGTAPPARAAAESPSAPPTAATMSTAMPAMVRTEVPRAELSALGDATMLDLFRTETEAYATALSDGLLALERAPDKRVPLDALMRAAHSIKGAARIVGLDTAVRIAHGLEDCLAAARAGKLNIDAHAVDELLAAVDLLAQLAKVPGDSAVAWLRERAPRFADVGTRLEILRTNAGVPVSPEGAAPVSSESWAAQPAASSDEEDRVVRLAASDLNRMLALAGEVRVQTTQLRPLAGQLLRIQARQDQLVGIIDQLRNAQLDPKSLELLQSARKLGRATRQAVSEQVAHINDFLRRSEDVGERLYRQTITSRMRPFGDGARGFARMVRDLGRQLGKQVDIEIDGVAVGVDRDILDRLEAPLGHMIRNAIDHGIESPQARRAAGKPERGTIRIEARHWAGRLSIRVSDDGRGIDVAAVRAKIVKRGFADEARAAAMSENEVFDYLFRSGFSTAEQITDVSGRGVGLDVVQEMVHSVAGTLRLTSEPGHGTTIHMQMPLTLSVVRVVMVAIGGDAYALPLRRVQRVLSLRASEIRTLENRPFFAVGKEQISLVGAREVLELEGVAALPDPLCVVVIGENQTCGLAVDRFLGELDVVVRPLDRRLGKVRDVSAVTTTATGDPMLILDVDDLLSSVQRMASSGRTERLRVGDAGAPDQRKRILVVDDSLTVRETERQLLVNRGYDVTTASDGVDAWETVQSQAFDLVVTDVDMPRRDGIELIRMIKADARLSNMPVMIVSYRERDEDKLRGRDAGADYYLAKSNFHDDTLIAAVVDLIGPAVVKPAPKAST